MSPEVKYSVFELIFYIFMFVSTQVFWKEKAGFFSLMSSHVDLLQNSTVKTECVFEKFCLWKYDFVCYGLDCTQIATNMADMALCSEA